jgi:hypothetical protein
MKPNGTGEKEKGALEKAAEIVMARLAALV